MSAAPSAGKNAQSFGHAVGLGGEHHPPLGQRISMALFGAARVSRDHARCTAGAELTDGLRSGAAQDGSSICPVVLASNGTTAFRRSLACRT